MLVLRRFKTRRAVGFPCAEPIVVRTSKVFIPYLYNLPTDTVKYVYSFDCPRVMKWGTLKEIYPSVCLSLSHTQTRAREHGSNYRCIVESKTMPRLSATFFFLFFQVAYKTIAKDRNDEEVYVCAPIILSLVCPKGVVRVSKAGNNCCNK